MSENESHELVRPGDSSVIARRGFGMQEVEMRRETAATALAEHVKATVQAKFIMALQRPRRPEEAWAKLVKECERFGFAEAGMYRLPTKLTRTARTVLPIVTTATDTRQVVQRVVLPIPILVVHVARFRRSALRTRPRWAQTPSVMMRRGPLHLFLFLPDLRNPRAFHVAKPTTNEKSQALQVPIGIALPLQFFGAKFAKFLWRWLYRHRHRTVLTLGGYRDQH